MGFQKIAASAQVVADGSASKLSSVDITPGSDDCKVEIFNGAADSDPKCFHGVADKSVSDETKHFDYTPGIYCDDGLYVKVTGTTPVVVVTWY